jgi:hypothetical protein
MHSHHPPRLLEIVGLPVAGAIVVEALHTPRTELILFFVPFAVAALRLFVAQFELPAVAEGERAARAARSCVALNQFAVFVLILLECGVVVAGNPTTPGGLWAWVAVMFAVYVGLRLWGRRCWFIAAESAEA